MSGLHGACFVYALSVNSKGIIVTTQNNRKWAYMNYVLYLYHCYKIIRFLSYLVGEL